MSASPPTGVTLARVTAALANARDVRDRAAAALTTARDVRDRTERALVERLEGVTVGDLARAMVGMDDDPPSDDDSPASDGDGPASDGDGPASDELNSVDGPMPGADAGVAPVVDGVEGGPLRLSDDPAVVVAVNEAFRRPDAVGDLWTADQLHAAMPRPYKFAAPTVAPLKWPRPAPLTQAAYSERFAAKFPEVAALGARRAPKNIVVAGGAAAWPFGENESAVGDVDLFVYGLDPADGRALWTVVGDVVGRLTKAFLGGVGGAPPRARMVTQMMSPGVLTLYASNRVHGESSVVLKVQIILRAYPSVSAILHAFDVPSACVAYDWRRAYTTTLGAFALLFRVNIVVPAYRSTTYEARLVKYFNRGFAIALRHIRRDVFGSGQGFALPHLVVRDLIVCRGPFAVGAVALPAATLAEAGDASDYDPPMYNIWSAGDSARLAASQANFMQIATGGRRFIATASVREDMVADDTDDEIADFTPRRVPRSLPFAKYARNGPPGLADILSQARFEGLVGRAVNYAVDPKGRLNCAMLRRVFGLDSAQITKLVEAVARAQGGRASRWVNVGPALAPFRAALLAKYPEDPFPIEWWITVDPGRQYTASCNPRIEDPADWYGDAFDAAGAPAADDYVEALLGHLELYRGDAAGAEGRVYNSNCPLCHEPIARGATNSVILGCGHVYHWARSDTGCRGLFAWVAQDHADCPTCRQDFGTVVVHAAGESETDDDGAGGAQAAREVHVEW